MQVSLQQNFPPFYNLKSYQWNHCISLFLLHNRFHQLSKIVSMEQVSERDKRKGKAKVEESADESLSPKSDIIVDDPCFFLNLEGDLRFEDAVGPDSLHNVTRREFLVRYRDIPSFLGEEDERLKRIQKASGATIGIVSDPEVRFHRQAHLELWGTVDQVKIAELLILDAITEMYGKSFAPTTLMPPTICRNEVCIPLLQASHLLGMNDENIAKIEVRSGAWMQVDPIELPLSGEPWMRRINIFGSHQQIRRVMIMIDKILHVESYTPEDTEHQESGKLEDVKKKHNDSEHAKEVKSEKLENINESPLFAAAERMDHVAQVHSSPNSKLTTI